MYQRPRRKITDEPAGRGAEIPPRWPEQAFPVPARENADSGSDSVDGGSRIEIQGVYIISVAARMLEMHPQTLRKYERLGLINPQRTGGMLRLYSREDIAKILLIRHLMEHLGLNLAGVEFALNIVENLVELEERLSAAAEGTSLEEVVQQEINRIFRRLNLPV